MSNTYPIIDSSMNIVIDEGLENLIPVPTKEEVLGLTESIRCNGIQTPIILWLVDGTFIIVDGHHRYKIGMELGVDIPYSVKDFTDDIAVRMFMIHEQLGRRNLTKDAKLLLAYELNKLNAEQKREADQANITSNDTGRTVEKTVHQINDPDVTVTGLKRITAVIKKAIPEVKDLYFNRDISLTAAADISREPEDVQHDIIKNSITYDKVDSSKLYDNIVSAKQARYDIESNNVIAKRLKLADESAEQARIEKLRRDIAEGKVVVNEYLETPEQEAFRKWYEGNVQTLTIETSDGDLKARMRDNGEEITQASLIAKRNEEQKRIKDDRKIRFETFVNMPDVVKQALMNGIIKATDAELLDAEGVLVNTSVSDIDPVANKIRADNREAEWNKRQAAAQAREETQRKKEAQEQLIDRNNMLKLSNRAHFETLKKWLDAGELFCPIHGPKCTCEFGQFVDKVRDLTIQAHDNITQLRPDLSNVDKQVNVIEETTDGKRINTVTRVVPKRINAGRTYVEEVPTPFEV